MGAGKLIRRAALAGATLAAFFAVVAGTATASVLGPWLPGAGPQDLSTTFDSNGYPVVAGAPDGSLVSAWPELSGSIGVAIRPPGGSAFAAASGPSVSGGVRRIAIAVAPDGAITLVWSTPNRDILYESTRPAGSTTFGAPVAIDTGPLYTVDAPAIAIGPSGVTNIVWAQGAFGAKSAKVASRPAGGSAFDVATLSSDNARYTAVADGPDGTVVAWMEDGSGGGSEVAVATRPPSSSTASGFSTPETLGTTPVGAPDPIPNVAEGSDGATTVAWPDVVGGTVSIASRPAGSSSATGFTDRTNISDPSPADLSVAAGPDGEATVAWARSGSPTINLQSTRLGAAASFSTPQQLTPPTGSWGAAAQPRTTYSPDGTAVATWYQEDTTAGKDRVIAASRAPGLAEFDLASATDISTGAGSNNAEYQEVAVSGDGTFGVVWILWGSPDKAQARWSQQATQELTVTNKGTEKGTISSSPAGIDCGATCSARFDTGTEVTLTATPTSGSKFVGWGGDCSGTSTTCTVTMNRLRDVVGEFSSDSPTPPTPSNSFSQGSSRVEPGRVVTPITVPGPGRITQSATRRTHGRTVSACRSVTRSPDAKGTYRMVCRLNSATRAARRRGPVRITLRTTYTPSGGTPRTRTRILVLPRIKSRTPHFTG